MGCPGLSCKENCGGIILGLCVGLWCWDLLPAVRALNVIILDPRVVVQIAHDDVAVVFVESRDETVSIGDDGNFDFFEVFFVAVVAPTVDGSTVDVALVEMECYDRSVVEWIPWGNIDEIWRAFGCLIECSAVYFTWKGAFEDLFAHRIDGFLRVGG